MARPLTAALLAVAVILAACTSGEPGASPSLAEPVDSAAEPREPRGATPGAQQGGQTSGRLGRELLAAARKGDAEQVSVLLARGADVEARDPTGATPLVLAAYRNDLDVAALLMAAGADVNAKDATTQSAFLIATSENYLGLLELTLAHGARVNSKDSFNGTGLIRAADRGHYEVVRRLLETAIEVDHVNRLGWTALLEAIVLGDGGSRHTRTVRLLVEGGVDVNLADADGVTPLAHAERRGYAVIAKVLRSAGARS